MPNPIVECIANYSEGRRPEVIAAISAAITSVPGVRILDLHSDSDHNRTVITYIGTPQAIEEAAFLSIQTAAQHINLDEHSGEHPRIGATDVVPFVPIADVSMQECVTLAQRLGQRVGSELKIPVYLYEEAATRTERHNLENIRRGEYETLKTEIETRPERAPDYGPSHLGTAGATVIGARQPLIAYNVYLTSDDLSIAKKIAKAVRHSSGGLRYVKALEMLVDGRAQISMNLTNYRGTPVFRVVEMIRREANRYGMSIHHSELVGLIPQAALIDSAVWYLQLEQFEPDQILETRLYQAQSAEEAPSAPDFLEALASGATTPGGGSAAAYSGATAAALVAMVARLTVGRKKYVAVEAKMQAIIVEADRLRYALQAAVEQDAEAYTQVMNAYKLSKGTPDQERIRSEAIERATLHAIEVPLKAMQMALEALKLAEQVIANGNLNALSDGGVGAALARAALTGAALNVRINANSLRNPEAAQASLQTLQQLEQEAQALEASISRLLAERGHL